MAWQLKLNSRECIGCGICADVCPDEGIILTREMAYPQPNKPCMSGCQMCVRECPVNAIEVSKT